MVCSVSSAFSYEQLQAENARLRQLLEGKDAELAARAEEIARLNERLQLLLSKRYQGQSETLKHLQRSLFDESELEASIEDARKALAEAEHGAGSSAGCGNPAAKPKSNPPKRKPLPAHLRRIEIELDVSADERARMGDDWVCVGFECSEQLGVSQREYFVKVYKRKKYVRKRAPVDELHSAQAQPGGGITLTPAPNVMLPRSMADASLLADVLTSKFVDAVSFYRTRKRLNREGIDIGYSTLCDWPIQLYERLRAWQSLWLEELQHGPLWHLDETTLQVLKEPARENTKKSYLWAVRGGLPDRPIVLFHYAERRDYVALEQWLRPALRGFGGAIVSDEHGSYNLLCKNHANIEAHGGCWAHARRKFADAAKGRRHSSEAHQVLKLIKALYRADNALKRLSGDDKRQARHERVKPALDAIHAHLLALVDRFLNRGTMNTAIGYALNNWHKLSAFIEHPVLPLDNNPIERAIRPFTLGRKNWMLAGSPRGAHASAFIYSLVESAKANQLEPKAYLNALFERFPLARTDDERRALLPTRFQFS